MDFDPDRRLALILFLRSRDVDVLGARDAVDARHQAEAHGVPRVILTVGGEHANAAQMFPGIPCRVVPAESLRAWLADPGGSVDSLPATLREAEAFVRREIVGEKRAPMSAVRRADGAPR
jgi:hypothetical protein